MHLAIRHTTRYRFAKPIARALQRLRLTPKATHGQGILEWSMSYEGAKQELAYEDHNCNLVTLVAMVPGVQELELTCRGLVDTTDNSGVIGRHSGHLPLWSFRTQTDLTRPGPRLRALVSEARGQGGEPLEMLHTMSALILERVPYQAGKTDPGTTAEAAVAAGHGVCQDHAHLFIGAARALGVPARYVSGYLLLEEQVDQEATHAWAEAHVEGLGWVGFDVSNQICPDERYVRVATGRDYREAAPVTGVSFGAGEQELHVELAVEQQVEEQ